MRLSRHVCGYIGREVGVLRYELYGLVTLLYRVQVDSHVREPWTVRLLTVPRYDTVPGPPRRPRYIPTVFSLESTQTTVCTVRYAHSLHSTDTASIEYSIADSLDQ